MEGDTADFIDDCLPSTESVVNNKCVREVDGAEESAGKQLLEDDNETTESVSLLQSRVSKVNVGGTPI